jgi:glutamine amidotransferase
VIILDLGWGNIGALESFFSRFTPNLVTVNPLERLEAVTSKNCIVVWPGVGSARQVQNWNLSDRQLLRRLFDEAEKNIAICLGFQILFGWHEEGECTGLNIFSGTVRRLGKPHIGYKTLSHSIEEKKRFYFNHSFYINGTSENENFMLNFSGNTGVALRLTQRFLGCQFHPEKSGRAGIKLIEKFLT